ncbi:CPBP family intramembrane glutamic endopeptidase [Exiguobacterium sp. USCH10]|jgi:membrane protease YdiL (CAAX protease family)|uniref:CPBP family intramembrane glutamic endopeptidase n=1 Tax=Exiguobacterium sp. USCH10 TaxID=3024839 RepID=UPI0030A2B3F1
MLNQMQKKTTPIWTWNQFAITMVLLFGVTPLLIERQLHNFLEQSWGNTLYSGTSIGLLLAIIFMTVLYLVAIRPQTLSLETLGLRRFPLKDSGIIFLWTIVLIVLSIIIVIVQSYFGIGTSNTKTESLQSDLSIISILIAFGSAAIVSPIYEEIFYRGFLYRFFQERFGVGIGMIASAGIFTLAHLPTTNTLLVNFVSGLVFAWVYERTNSIYSSMLIHGTFNGLAVLLTALA